MYMTTVIFTHYADQKLINVGLCLLFIPDPRVVRFFESMYFSRLESTLPTAEILSGKNVRAFLFCGFLMKSLKKYILQI